MQKNRHKSKKGKEKHFPKEAATGEILGDNHYTVEKIKGKRTKGGQYEYLIEWTGFPGGDTWERMENLEYVTALVEEYEEGLKMEKDKRKVYLFASGKGMISEVMEEKEASLNSSKGEQKESVSKYCYTLKKQMVVEERKLQESAPQISRKQEPSIDKPQTTGRLFKPVSIKFSGELLPTRPQPNLPSHPTKLLKPSSITFPFNPKKDPQTNIPQPFIEQ